MKKETTSDRLQEIMQIRNLRQVDILNLSKPFCEKYGVKLGKNDLSQYVNGKVEPRQEKLTILGLVLNVSEAWLMGYDVPMERNVQNIPSDAIPYNPTGQAPVLGRIPAGSPLLADEYIEGYEPIDRPHPEEYYWLRVQGDSMIGARIFPGDLVLIHMQDYAENGQIVACRVNGDEATLKRYHEQGDSVILLPENSDYEPRIINKKEFAIGYAAIMGVAVESKRKL